MWRSDNTEADYFPPGVSAVSQLPWRIPRRSRPRDTRRRSLAAGEAAPLSVTEEVDRLIAACDGTDPGRLRDRAIVLMLVRLGLRAGDVAQSASHATSTGIAAHCR